MPDCFWGAGLKPRGDDRLSPEMVLSWPESAGLLSECCWNRPLRSFPATLKEYIGSNVIEKKESYVGGLQGFGPSSPPLYILPSGLLVQRAMELKSA